MMKKTWQLIKQALSILSAEYGWNTLEKKIIYMANERNKMEGK